MIADILVILARCIGAAVTGTFLAYAAHQLLTGLAVSP